MAIEHSNSGTLITGEHIELFNLMRAASALGLEINTGMKMSRGVNSREVANRLSGSTAKTKRKALADLVAFTTAKFPEYKPAPSVVKALAE